MNEARSVLPYVAELSMAPSFLSQYLTFFKQMFARPVGKNNDLFVILKIKQRCRRKPNLKLLYIPVLLSYDLFAFHSINFLLSC